METYIEKKRKIEKRYGRPTTSMLCNKHDRNFPISLVGGCTHARHERFRSSKSFTARCYD